MKKLVFLVSLAFIGTACAHDHNRPDLDDWYTTLHSKKGPCCGGPKTDATQLEDLDWQRDGDHYKVLIKGKWIEVPEEAVVYGPNKAGRALVWLYYMQGEPVVRCFMPGMLT